MHHGLIVLARAKGALNIAGELGGACRTLAQGHGLCGHGRTGPLCGHGACGGLAGELSLAGGLGHAGVAYGLLALLAGLRHDGACPFGGLFRLGGGLLCHTERGTGIGRQHVRLTLQGGGLLAGHGHGLFLGHIATEAGLGQGIVAAAGRCGRIGHHGQVVLAHIKTRTALDLVQGQGDDVAIQGHIEVIAYHQLLLIAVAHQAQLLPVGLG